MNPEIQVTRRVILLALLAISLLGITERSASAAYLHPTLNYSFGKSGTSGSTFNGLEGVAYQQSTKRLYALSATAPATIHAFTYEGLSTFSLVGGNWPLEVENSRFFYPGLTVDNSSEPSAGHVLYASPCGCFESYVYAFDPDGSSLFSFSVSHEGPNGVGAAAVASGVSVDSHGNIWVANSNPEKVEEFSPSGGAAFRKIETQLISKGNEPEKLVIDPSNDDLYVSLSNKGVYRLKAASGYSEASAELFAGSYGPAMAIDGSIHRLYQGTYGSGVRVYSTVTGAFVESLGSGEINGLAVDETTHNVFVASEAEGKVQEWRAVAVPDVTTGPPVGNTKVSGAVGLGSSGLEVTSCKVQFGVNTSYGSEAPCEPAAPYTADQPTVTADLSVLEPIPHAPEVTYHYRLVAKNTNGLLSAGEDQTITPRHVSLLQTDPATNVQRESATLNGSYEGTGEDTIFHFEWGPTPAYGNKTTEVDKGVTSGPTSVSADISELEPETTYYYRVVAENPKGETKAFGTSFVTAPAIKSLVTKAATEVNTTSVKLNGSLDPDGFATEFYFEYGRTTRYGHTAPAPPGESVGTEAPGTAPVSTLIETLEPGLLYHFRVVATNKFGTTIGQDEAFTTQQPPSIDGFSSSNVTGTSADLTASINSHGAETTYFFEYGTTPEYGSRAPIPDGVIAAGNSPESIVAHVAGLSELTYHFRLTAESKWGSVTSEDQTFDFALPAGCPNHSVRQQTRAGYLPDCRAYELVSPGRAGGAYLYAGQGPTSPFATNPARFAFFGLINGIPGTGEPMVGTKRGDLYVSSRTNQGWTTRYVGIPGNHSLSMSGPWAQYYEGEGIAGVPTDLQMNQYLVWDRGQKGSLNGGTLEGSYAPFMYDNQGNFIRRLPTNVEELAGATNDVTEGGFTGYERSSPDFSHYVFTSTSLAFAEGGLTEAPGSVYDNDIEAETVKVVSRTPTGEDIPRDLGAPPLLIPTGGTEPEYMKVPALSNDGSHILMSTMGPGPTHPQVANEPSHLYLSVDDALFYEVSLGDDMKNHAVKFVGMTEDGSTVYFISAEQLTGDDTDHSVDLYQWNENGGSPTVTRVSTGTGTTGNADNCEVTWISNCDIEVVPLPPAGGGGTAPTPDTALSAKSGEIYFYSPEELDTTHGAFGKRNLYVYREGRPRHVATLEPNKPLSRIQVAPDGSHMGMVTSSQLTSYNNNSAAEMYTYEPATRKVVCVSCRPDGALPESQVTGALRGRFITDDGRAFFNTGEALVPRDADGIPDVYEYVNGRPQLITSGTSEASFSGNQILGLVGVSADGTDVFFGTTDTLVAADENGPFLKFYDARVNGGFLEPEAVTPCVAADECHGAEAEPPAPPSIGTGASLGAAGNLHSTQTKKKKKAKRRNCGKGRCRHKKGRKANRHHHRVNRRHRKGGQHG